MALVPTSASADHHIMNIREVFPGASNTGFVELQMVNGGQNFVAPHDITTYGPTGVLINTFEFPDDVTQGGSQRTVLVGENSAAGSPDFMDNGLNMSAGGGGACFISDDFGAIDCVSWGNFTGTLPSSTGDPVSLAGVTAGKSLTRSIAQGCATLLDGPDDSGDSATDFAETDPSPRNNSVTPTETVCPTPPNTTIAPNPRPPQFTNQTTASFAYSASGGTGAVTFECKLDTEPGFTDCTAGATKQYTDVPEGLRTFSVRATASGVTDPTPATYSWTVDLTDPDTTISPTGLPSNPTGSATAAFSFASSEPTGATFKCKLDTGTEEDCTTGKSYSNLQTGEHTFTVAAIDRAGNRDDTAASYTWTVDRDPPTTDLTNVPDNPSVTNGAEFSFASEAGATFSCRLDDEPATACNSGTITYNGLNDGEHTFRVRATDALGNVETAETHEPGRATPSPGRSTPPLTRRPRRRSRRRRRRRAPTRRRGFSSRPRRRPTPSSSAAWTTSPSRNATHRTPRRS